MWHFQAFRHSSVWTFCVRFLSFIQIPLTLSKLFDSTRWCRTSCVTTDRQHSKHGHPTRGEWSPGPRGCHTSSWHDCCVTIDRRDSKPGTWSLRKWPVWRRYVISFNKGNPFVLSIFFSFSVHVLRCLLCTFIAEKYDVTPLSSPSSYLDYWLFFFFHFIDTEMNSWLFKIDIIMYCESSPKRYLCDISCWLNWGVI